MPLCVRQGRGTRSQFFRRLQQISVPGPIVKQCTSYEKLKIPVQCKEKRTIDVCKTLGKIELSGPVCVVARNASRDAADIGPSKCVRAGRVVVVYQVHGVSDRIDNQIITVSVAID